MWKERETVHKTKNVLNQQDLKFVFHLLHWVQECKFHHHYSFTYPEAKLLKKIPFMQLYV